MICSQPIGLRLCGIAEEPFWPLPNGSSTSPISVFCRPRISSGELLERGRGNRQRRHQLGVPIALDDLRRHRRRLEAEAAADASLNVRIEVRERADRAGQFPDRDHVAGAQDAVEVALQLGVPQRQLEAERHRFGVHAVRPADHRRAPVLLGAGAHGVHQRGDPLDDEAAGLAHLKRLGGVDDVG